MCVSRRKSLGPGRHRSGEPSTRISSGGSLMGNELLVESAEPTVNGYTYRQVAKSIDHSLLKPELTEQQVEEGLQIAIRYDVASVCCRPSDVPLAARLLSGNIDYVQQDIAAVVEAASDRALVKVILENAYLTEDQTVTASKTVAIA